MKFVALWYIFKSNIYNTIFKSVDFLLKLQTKISDTILWPTMLCDLGLCLLWSLANVVLTYRFTVFKQLDAVLLGLQKPRSIKVKLTASNLHDRVPWQFSERRVRRPQKSCNGWIIMVALTSWSRQLAAAMGRSSQINANGKTGHIYCKSFCVAPISHGKHKRPRRMSPRIDAI